MLTSKPLSSLIPPSLRVPLKGGLAIAFATALVSLAMHNQYRSEARILPADSRGSGGSMTQMAAVVGVTIPGQDSPDAAYVDILESRRLRKQILDETYAFRVRAFPYGPWRNRQEKLSTYLKIKNLDRGVAAVKRIITVSRDLKTKLLKVAATTDSPELSSQIVRKAVKSLNEFVTLTSRTRGGNKAAFTRQRLDEANVASAEAERAFREFLEVHRNYQSSNEPMVKLEGSRLETAVALRKQVMTTLTLTYEQALIEEKNDMPILNVLDEGDVPSEKSGPPRTIMVLLAFLFGTAGIFAWMKRMAIWEKIQASPSD